VLRKVEVLAYHRWEHYAQSLREDDQRERLVTGQPQGIGRLPLPLGDSLYPPAYDLADEGGGVHDESEQHGEVVDGQARATFVSRHGDVDTRVDQRTDGQHLRGRLQRWGRSVLTDSRGPERAEAPTTRSGGGDLGGLVGDG